MRTLALALALIAAAPALAVPMQLTHQGRLDDAAGVPLTGLHQLDVTLYAEGVGGSPLWTERLSTEFDQGVFSVVLGASPSAALDSGLFDGSVRYLGIAVDDGAELPQRLAVVSVPYAVRAGSATSATTADTASALDGELDWAQLTNVPPDADSFAELLCAEAQVPTWQGDAWACASPVPASVDVGTLSGTIAIANLPIGTGDTQVAAGDHTHSFSQITGELPLSRTLGDLDIARVTGDLPLARTTGDLDIGRTTGNIPYARLPVGTVANTVAAGNHTHTAAQVGAIPAGSTVPVSDTAAACSSALRGHLKYDGTELALCDGTDWLPVRVGARFDGSSADNPAENCASLRTAFPGTPSGAYWVDPNGGSTADAYRAWCDMTSDGGGWTYDLHDGLVAYWSFDDNAGFGNADWGAFSGAITGSATNNGPAPATGLGRSMRFDNTDGQYLTLSPPVPFEAASTTLFWVRTTVCVNNQIPFIFDNLDYFHDNIRAGTVVLNGTRYLSENGVNNCSSRLNVWYHMAYVDTGSTYQVYQNGSLVTSTTLSYTSFDPRTLLHMGTRPGWGSNGLGGELDDVAIFSRALSQAEIQSVYTNATVRGRAFRWR